MKVLVACESSGTVRNAFLANGFDAWSCDLLPADDCSPRHIQGDALNIIHDDWDLVIAHPPCTYLSVSGLHWNARRPERREKTKKASEFFLEFTHVECPWAIENPIGCMSRVFRKQDQIIQPHQFGHNASKATCLWLYNLPLLRPTKSVPPRIVNGLPRWLNQTDSGQNNIPPSNDRWKIRSKTYQGIASAMAEQWGKAIRSGYRKQEQLYLPFCGGI